MLLTKLYLRGREVKNDVPEVSDWQVNAKGIIGKTYNQVAMIRKILNISLLIGQLLLNRSAQGLSTQQGANHIHKSVVSENDKPSSILMNVNEPKLTRRKWITSSLTSFGISQSILPLAYAAETVGKDENCNSPQCLGVWGGMLADCPHSKSMMSVGAGCASSQDDTPGVFSEP